MKDDLMDILRKAGYTVVEGKDDVFAAIAELAGIPTEKLCSGFGVFPDGGRCKGCRDCKCMDVSK